MIGQLELRSRISTFTSNDTESGAADPKHLPQIICEIVGHFKCSKMTSLVVLEDSYNIP